MHMMQCVLSLGRGLVAENSAERMRKMQIPHDSAVTESNGVIVCVVP